MTAQNRGNWTKKLLGASINWNWIAAMVSVLLLAWLAANANYRFQITFESNATSAQAATR